MFAKDVYSQNALKEMRAGSQFETFKPRHNSQQRARQALHDLSEQVIGASAHILDNEYPFEVGNIIVLRGKPGRGKTHLAEAFLNRLMQRVPKLQHKLVFAKGHRFSTEYYTGERPFGKASIIVIDDILADQQTKYENHPGLVRAFGKFIVDVYDHRQLVIVTSNIPLFTKGGIMDHMPAVDEVGRYASRAAEVVINDYELHGDDYRETISKRRKPATRLRVGPPDKKLLPTADELLQGIRRSAQSKPLFTDRDDTINRKKIMYEMGRISGSLNMYLESMIEDES